MKRVVIAVTAGAMIHGAAFSQDSAVSGLVITSGERPAPITGSGAPMYSPEQTASFVCSKQGDEQAVKLAEAAHRATVTARAVRRNPEATRSEMLRVERSRQDAVRAMLGVGAATQAQLVQMGVERFGGVEDPLTLRAGIKIEEVITRRMLENGRAVLLIGGKVKNTGVARAELVPLSTRVLDAGGFTLASQSSLLDKATLEPGETLTFVVRFRNPPHYISALRVGFSPQFQTRNSRSCDFFDPLTFNPRDPDVARIRAAATPVSLPKVGQGAPVYTAQELAQVFPKLLGQSQRAFDAARAGACPGDRYGWRLLFQQSELAYEAWVATVATDEIRRDASLGPVGPGELEAAELQRQRTVNAYEASRRTPVAAEACGKPG